MDFAVISPNPQINPERITCFLTGCTAKQFWYHFHNYNISPYIFSLREKERKRQILSTWISEYSKGFFFNLIFSYKVGRFSHSLVFLSHGFRGNEMRLAIFRERKIMTSFLHM